MSTETSQAILILEDEPMISELLSFHLTEKGYSLFTTASPRDAMEILSSQQIDLVLCDIILPEMDGLTFSRKLREDPAYLTVPFIFMTASDSGELKSEALESGSDEFIAKPIEFEELILKVEAMLQRRKFFKEYTIRNAGKGENTGSAVKPRVLLVDDDVSLCRLFKYNLDREGFECIAVDNATEALSVARSNMPDIIISDIMMPKVDGYEFRRQLLLDENLKRVPFLFLTSKSNEDEILDAYNLEITDYVLKTAGPRVVVAKVNALLRSLNRERMKVVKEIQSAADSLGAKVVPDEAPGFPGYMINFWHQPFEGIPGGDFLDFYQISEDQMVVVLGDVMGKRWGAWYFAMAYAGYIRSTLRVALQDSSKCSPKNILERVNGMIYRDAKLSEVFATLSILCINSSTNMYRYSGAGDLPIVIHRKLSGIVETVSSHGILLGFDEQSEYEEHSGLFEEGDRMILCTDGVTEARNVSNKLYGIEFLTQTIKNSPFEQDAVGVLKRRLFEFTTGKFDDDVSVIQIVRK